MSETDPYDTPEYQAFVEEMAKHCRCSPRYRPCDGVLAGGVCDQMVDEPDFDYHNEEYE